MARVTFTVNELQASDPGLARDLESEITRRPASRRGRPGVPLTMRRSGRPLVPVLLLTTALLGSSSAWCFCAPPAAAPSAHGCCDEGPGLAAAAGDCCRDRLPGPAAADAVVRGGGPTGTSVAAVLAPRPLRSCAAPIPIPSHAASSPALVLRV